MTPAAHDFATDLRRVLEEVEELLLEKNAAYGDSALTPLRLFAGDLDVSAQIRVRIDDKLSRLARGQRAGEDVELDLLGYLLLLRISRLRGPGGGQSGPSTQKRKAEPGAPLPPSPTPPSTSAPDASRLTATQLRRLRYRFTHRADRFACVPASVSWEEASRPDSEWFGLLFEASGRTLRTRRPDASDASPGRLSRTLRTPEPDASDASSLPSHSPLSSGNAGDLEEEEVSHAREPDASDASPGRLSRTLRTPEPDASDAGRVARTPDAPRDNALEVLARASKGRVSPFAGSRDQVALAAALADVGLVGSELEAFGAALAGAGASKLWPKSEPAKGRGALTCGFFLGRAGDARMLADGVTRWREAQQRARDEAAALARIAAPVVKAGPTPDEMVASASEYFRRRRAERLQGVSRAG